jgi:acyl-CoA dehydrogenase
MTDPLLIETADRVLAGTCTHEAIQAAEQEGWAQPIWDRVAEVELPWLSVPEAAGGAGGEPADALAVLRVAGRYAAPIPLAETGLLAGWLLAGAGLNAGRGPATVVPGLVADTLRLDRGALSGTAHRVPWARSADQIVALVESDGGWWVAAVPAAAAHVEPRVNLAGEPRDTVAFDGAAPTQLARAAGGVDAVALQYRGALTRVMLMAGALERMSRMTIAYCNERAQFGRPVARFQAVQQHLVTTAQEAALVGMAAETAARDCRRFEIAAAKLLANQAAATATRAAHQAHGAMGMTQEYPLHHLSRRLWAWRAEYGDDHFWSTRLGGAVAAAGADQLYPAITSGSTVLQLP